MNEIKLQIRYTEKCLNYGFWRLQQITCNIIIILESTKPKELYMKRAYVQYAFISSYIYSSNDKLGSYCLNSVGHVQNAKMVSCD